MLKIDLLIVEDDFHLRETWEMMFENFGYSIYTASNGLEAQSILDKKIIKLIITDIQMPLKDGYYVLEHIKTKKTNIITWVCSGQFISENPILSSFKIDKILTKPFDMVKTVKEVISILY